MERNFATFRDCPRICFAMCARVPELYHLIIAEIVRLWSIWHSLCSATFHDFSRFWFAARPDYIQKVRSLGSDRPHRKTLSLANLKLTFGTRCELCQQWDRVHRTARPLKLRTQLKKGSIYVGRLRDSKWFGANAAFVSQHASPKLNRLKCDPDRFLVRNQISMSEIRPITPSELP